MLQINRWMLQIPSLASTSIGTRKAASTPRSLASALLCPTQQERGTEKLETLMKRFRDQEILLVHDQIIVFIYSNIQLDFQNYMINTVLYICQVNDHFRSTGCGSS